MKLAPENTSEPIHEKAANSSNPITGPPIYAYNLDDSKTPGGIKVRWKVRVVTGAQAHRIDTRQAEAIKELLAWSRRHPPRDQ